jgi:hypothetical protein
MQLMERRHPVDTEPWGIKVTKVEVKQGGHSGDDAASYRERERRAKIIHADGEFRASAKLAEAPAVLETQLAAIRLRYLLGSGPASGPRRDPRIRCLGSGQELEPYKAPRLKPTH